MKKKLLFPILLLGACSLVLSACDLSSLINGGGGEENPPVDPGSSDSGFRKLTFQHSTRSYNPEYTPLGDVKVLIVPISFSGSSTKGSWDSATLNSVNNYFFSTSNKTSFVNYYKTISYGKINFTGMVATPYQATESISYFNNDNDNSKLYTFLSKVLTSVTNDTSVDWTVYDKNNDGYFDAIHFITNYNAMTWGSSLWPHQSFSGLQPGTHSKPSFDNYSLSSIYVQGQKMEDALTQIHEQGHLFGVDDYYNYSDGFDGDYVSGFDMQGGANMFDWNAYSKMEVGLIDPYVVDDTKDEFTITIHDLATTGECLIIPANYSTYNKTPFDEYFLVQLFSKKGINKEYWSGFTSSYGDRLPSQNYGVMIYHVDARVYNWTKNQEATDPSKWDPSRNQYIKGCNNSKTYSDYGGNSAWSNYTLLNLVQNNGRYTHASSNYFIEKLDFFQKGDTFDWSKGKKFLLKSGNAASKMNKGETFPWTLEFTEMSLDFATIKISK